MPDYSEFPTTPTGWQERAWQDIAPLEVEAPPPPPKRRPDLVALIPGVALIVLAICVMAWASLPFLFRCDIKTPKLTNVGANNPYTITAAENLTGTFVTAPPVGTATNPAQVFFK